MSKIQKLLDKEAWLSNNRCAKQGEREAIHAEIKELRGSIPPPCWGEDDCSTAMLVRCPWRIDCGPDD